MGSGASVGGEERSEEDNTFKDYLGDKTKMEKLFADIAATSNQKKNALQRVNVTNLLNYFNDRPDPFIKNILKNKNVLLSAMKFTSQQEANSQITKENFHRLLASIYLFSHVWDVLGVVDEDHDKRISRAEFAKAKDLCSSMKFLHIGNISDEEWNRKFNILDTDHNGVISFYELCSYISRNVVNMETYLADDPPLASDGNEGKLADGNDDGADNKSGNHYDYVSASAAVAAWEAEQAYRAAQEEERQDNLLSKAGMIGHDSIRSRAIHSAVVKTEQAAKLAADALVHDNRDAALKAASDAERNNTLVAVALHGAVVERTHSIMGFEGSGHVAPTHQEGNSLFPHTIHMSHKEVHSENDHHHHLHIPSFSSLFHSKDPHDHNNTPSEKHDAIHSVSHPAQIPSKILENSEYAATPKTPKKLDS